MRKSAARPPVCASMLCSMKVWAKVLARSAASCGSRAWVTIRMMLLPRDDTTCRFFFTSSTAVRAAGADSETPPPAGRNLSQRLGLLAVFRPLFEVELAHDLFDQGVLLEHVRLRLHVDRIVGAGRRGGIDVAKVEEIVVDSLDLDGSLGLVYARLGDANERGGDDAEEGDPQQASPCAGTTCARNP